MAHARTFTFSINTLLVPLAAVLIIWSVYWIELLLSLNFNDWGVYPRTLRGLRGVIFSPFIHGSLKHLYNNTIPLAVLLASLFYFYRKVAWKILIVGIFFSGIITWGIGRPSYHIGASGVIYVLSSFIFFKGIFSKHYRLIALSLIVVFLYGSLLWYIFPVKDNISWEGHLAGFVTGFLMAFFIKTKIPKPSKFVWEHEDYNEEDDEFLKYFDADGNFIDNKENLTKTSKEAPLKINYIFKKMDKE